VAVEGEESRMWVKGVRETCATVAEHTRGAAANGAKRLIYVRF